VSFDIVLQDIRLNTFTDSSSIMSHLTTMILPLDFEATSLSSAESEGFRVVAKIVPEGSWAACSSAHLPWVFSTTDNLVDKSETDTTVSGDDKSVGHFQ
jgi:hypothetical protein